MTARERALEAALRGYNNLPISAYAEDMARLARAKDAADAALALPPEPTPDLGAKVRALTEALEDCLREWQLHGQLVDSKMSARKALALPMDTAPELTAEEWWLVMKGLVALEDGPDDLHAVLDIQDKCRAHAAAQGGK